MSPLRLEDIWDEEREKQHQDAIQQQLSRLTLWLVANAKRVLLDQDLIRRFHRQVFTAVFATDDRP